MLSRIAFALLLTLPGIGAQTDLLVDPTGGPGTYPTITAAMLAAHPNDRILVTPGTYGGFQFSRGVDLVGLGDSPSDVVIQRIGFHISIPATDARALISNVTVRSANPLDVFAISGNELAPGVLTLDGCVLENGVYLRGGQAGFYVMMNNCRIVPPAGHGFSGEACRIGGPGNFVDIRNTRILGWDADPVAGIPAGVALRVVGGTNIRVSGSEVIGGDGVAVAGLEAGADGLAGIAPGVVDLRLDGGATVRGGDGAGSGAGGHGVAITGSAATGTASVTGGAGTPPGMPWSLAQPVGLMTHAHLAITPRLQFADGSIAVEPGQTITVTLGGPQTIGMIGVALASHLPDDPSFVSIALETLVIIPSSTFTTVVPSLAPINYPGAMFYVQGVVGDPISGQIIVSDAAAIRVDW
jgi:hypothetical protein